MRGFTRGDALAEGGGAMTHSHRVVVWYSNDARVAYCDEPACSGYRHEAKAGVCWPVGANQKLRSVEAVCGNRYTPKGTMSSKACTLPRLHDGSCGQRKT